MKNNIIKVAAVLSMLAMPACVGYEFVQDAPVQDYDGMLKKVQITGKDFQFEGETRSSVTITEKGASFQWDDDDVIGIFPDQGDQVSFAMEAGAGTQTATFSGGGWALKSSAKYAAYYPHVYENRDMTKIPVSYVGQTQNGHANTDHIGAYDFMAAGVSTPENGAVAFDMQHLGCLVQIKIIVPEAGTTLNYVTLYTEYTASFMEDGYIDLSQDSPAITPERLTSAFSLKLDNITTSKDSEVVIAYMMIAPTDLTKSEFTISINYDTQNSSNKLYVCSVPSKNLKAGKAYSFSIEMPDPYYRTVTMTKAGILSSILLDDVETINTLKISGPINGDDIRLLRNMAGVDVLNEETEGQLRVLDLSDAKIVEGGDYYATREKWTSTGEDYYLYTKNDIFGPFMFSYSKLTEIKLPTTITEIGDLALFDCNSLTKLTIPEMVSAIRVAAFMHCDNITDVILPENLSVLAESVFRACISLKDIPYWPSNITRIPYATFAVCSSFIEIAIPDNITQIDGSAFWDCTSMQRIDIPAGVTRIDGYAFQNCSSLKKLICYPTTPPTLGTEIFYQVARVPDLYTPYDSRDSYKYANGWYNYYKNSAINAIEWGI